MPEDENGPSPELIPGEMRLWSDAAPEALRPPASGRVVHALVARALGALGEHGRVLVAGPHSEEVARVVAGSGHDAVFVLRSLADATELLAGQPGARVVSGGLDAFEADPFDLVVALDGAERLLSNDSPEQSWRGRAELLASLLADGGTMLFSIDNPLSLLTFADARPVAERRDAGDWEPPTYVDPTRPASLAQATAALGGLGLAGPGFAAFPLTTAPAVLADVESADLADLRVQGALTASSARALQGRELLFDPAPETLRAIAAGKGAELAPGWVFVLSRGESGRLPRVIFEDHPGRPGALVLGLEGGEASALETPVGIAQLRQQDMLGAANDVTTGQLSRRDIPEGRLPAGRLLATVLADLALREDLPTLRGVVGRYLTRVKAVLDDDADDTDAGAAVLFTPDNVLTVAGGTFFVPLDATWRWTGEVSPDEAVARVALAAARGLLDRRLRRIWPPWTGVPELGRSLASMAELSFDETTWQRAEELDSVLAKATEPPVVLDHDVRSVRALNAQLLTELESARGEVFAHERLAANRDRQLEQRSNRQREAELRAAQAEADVEAVRQSGTFRLGRAIRHPSYGARAFARRVRRS